MVVFSVVVANEHPRVGRGYGVRVIVGSGGKGSGR